MLRIPDKVKKDDIRQGRTGSKSTYAERTYNRPGFSEEIIESIPAEDDRADYRTNPWKYAPKEGGRRSGRRTVPSSHRLMINWAMIATVLLVLALFGAAGGYVYLKTTDAGQLILARLGREANAEALWALGTEYLDQGYIDRAITSYETAFAQEPEREDIYNKLLLLGEAYEAGGYYKKAEDLYISLYTDHDPANPAAYRLLANLLNTQGRTMELADFLKLAYDKTGDASFSRQRAEMIPTTPTISLDAGKHQLDQSKDEHFKTVELMSSEGYDIYYVLRSDENSPPKIDDLMLPEEGIKYTQPILLGKGFHALRAVALSSDLVSDEMSVNYTITSPVPLAPRLSLAPGTYETKQRVWIRYLGDDADTVTIYYTIDGQSPKRDSSPIYTGDPITLPGGRVHVKAIAINSYDMISNEMDVELKINIPFKHYFNSSDSYGNFTLLTTSRDAFVRSYGTPVTEEEIVDPIAPRCLELTYPWGYARFMASASGYVIYAFETTSSSYTGPRSTKIGMSEQDITDKFRDMGQAPNQNGDRSIYWDEAAGSAKIYKVDDENSRIEYIYNTDDNASVVLTYYLKNNSVVRVSVRYK